MTTPAMKVIFGLIVRLVLTAGLLAWVWTGSRLALVIFCALAALAIELLNLTSPMVVWRRP